MPLDFKTPGGSLNNTTDVTRDAGLYNELHNRTPRKIRGDNLPGVDVRKDAVVLSPSEARRLLGLCIELLDLCSKVTGKIDPAVGAMVAYARDEAMTEALDAGS